jgi:hypothetical protein
VQRALQDFRMEHGPAGWPRFFLSVEGFFFFRLLFRSSVHQGVLGRGKGGGEKNLSNP